MEGPHKIHVKLGASEFTYEGSEAGASQAYEKFLAALQTVPASQAVPAPANGLTVPPREMPAASTGHTPALMARVYSEDPRTGISLRVLPRTDDRDSDAIVLILYGYAILRNEHAILAGQLTKAAKQSGLTAVTRVDRHLTAIKYAEMTTKSGQRSGSRYGLNNRGTAYASELLERLLA